MKRRPRKYQSKLTLYPMTFEQVVDTVLAYKPRREKGKQLRKPRKRPSRKKRVVPSKRKRDI